MVANKHLLYALLRLHCVNQSNYEDVVTEEFEIIHNLIAEVARRMNRECETPYAKLIAPFMERNGYRDGCGRWVKK